MNDELLEQIATATAASDRLTLTCSFMLQLFDRFYSELCDYPYQAQRAFEQRDPQQSIRISHERLNLYSEYIERDTPRLLKAFPDLGVEESLWEALEQCYIDGIADRYEADIAFSFMHSIKRRIYIGEWRPVEYSFSQPSVKRAKALEQPWQRFAIDGTLSTTQVADMLVLPGFAIGYHEPDTIATKVAERFIQLERLGEYGDASVIAVDVLRAGFFRDVTGFIVGRVVKADETHAPFILALLNGEQGIMVDAFLHKTADAHNLLSSTLANFHVTNELYYQICVFLYSIMPLRPLGLHYSTIGFNHVGKVAVLNELKEQMHSAGQVLGSSPGFDGTVAIGFTFAASTYHLKVVRDKPTKSYKWGEFGGIDAVLDQYRIVHQINRTGSMVDNIIYHNLRLDREMFDPELLQDLALNASESVSISGDQVLFKSLIVQLKIVPLPVYFERASDREIRKIINNLGHCIKNNAAANIFNKDLDGRNYGVGRYDKVFLFDYDAVEKLTDVKIRTNLDRVDGEEDIPDWYFEEGVVFLPEEIESGLQLDNREARRHFRETHADLMTVEYWQGVQDRLSDGEVVALRTYPEGRKLG